MESLALQVINPPLGLTLRFNTQQRKNASGSEISAAGSKAIRSFTARFIPAADSPVMILEFLYDQRVIILQLSRSNIFDLGKTRNSE